MEDIRIRELRRNLFIRKDKFAKSLSYICKLFSIDGNRYMNEFDSISNEMVDVGIELNKVFSKMDELDLKFEKLKRELLFKENINLRDRINEFGNEKKYIIDKLGEYGFISTEEVEILSDEVWRNRYRVKYSD